MTPRLFFLTLVVADGTASGVRVLACSLDEAMALAAKALGPCQLNAHGSRTAEDLMPGGTGVVQGGGRLLPSPYDSLIRPGAIKPL
jgi:hypothetical protein